MTDARLLDDLAKKYGSDKASGPGNNAYMDLYEEYFKRQGFTRESVGKVLEIGTNKGSSLRIWADFFPNAQIYGIDITRQYELPGMLDHDRVHTSLVDQGSRDALQKEFDHIHFSSNYADYFDIIIDDGSHEQTHQQISWGVLFPLLKPAGLYVIEDIITGENWWDGNLYNQGRIIPTRAVVQTLEQTGQLESPVMEDSEIKRITKNYSYCEYRESPAIIFGTHHPQLAFIGKR